MDETINEEKVKDEERTMSLANLTKNEAILISQAIARVQLNADDSVIRSKLLMKVETSYIAAFGKVEVKEGKKD